MSDKMKLFQKLHWFSLMIGAGSILLPIIFWKQIPQEIPMHYNAAGIVDRWEDKSSLILLFFVIAFLMGMMSITVYVVKSNMLSKYTNSDEVSLMQMVYPLIILMNVVLQGTFAYLMFCSVTTKNLGKLFLPIVMVLVFVPIGVLLFLGIKGKAGDKSQKNLYKMREKEEINAETHRSAIDWWLAFILLGCIFYMVYLLVVPMVKEHRIDWLILGITVGTSVLILPLFSIRYVFYSDHLLVSMSFYGHVRIRYSDIVEVKKTNNPLSSAALSLRRIQIDYVENGVHRMVLISPTRRNEFIEKLNVFREKY